MIERLLAKDPADRYDSSRDLYRELKQLRERLSDTTASSVTIAANVAPVAKPRIGWRLALLTAMAGAGVASALTWAWRLDAEGPDLAAIASRR